MCAFFAAFDIATQNGDGRSRFGNAGCQGTTQNTGTTYDNSYFVVEVKQVSTHKYSFIGELSGGVVRRAGSCDQVA
jgi:hypothetical protein